VTAHVLLDIPSNFFLSAFTTNIMNEFLRSACVLRVRPISFSLIWSSYSRYSLKIKRIRHGFNHRLFSYTILYEGWQTTSNWNDSPIKPHQNIYWTHKIKLKLPHSIRRCITTSRTHQITLSPHLNLTPQNFAAGAPIGPIFCTTLSIYLLEIIDMSFASVSSAAVVGRWKQDMMKWPVIYWIKIKRNV
jgi:hypothetical protein